MEGPSAHKKKRSRSVNWLDEDKNLLLLLIKEKVHILENKNTDTNTNNKKKNAWVAVHESFNSLCKGGARTIDQLKVQWGHAKMTKKKERCAQRKQVFKTGGGGPPDIPPDNSEDIVAWLPHEFATDSNPYVSDQIVRIDSNKVEPLSFLSQTEETMEEIIEETKEVQEDVEQSKENEMPNTKDKTQDNINKKQEKKSETTNNYAKLKIKEITDTEIELKSQLHEKKIANQERKARNLDLKYRVLQAKLEYYQNKKEKDDKDE